MVVVVVKALGQAQKGLGGGVCCPCALVLAMVFLLI